MGRANSDLPQTNAGRRNRRLAPGAALGCRNAHVGMGGNEQFALWGIPSAVPGPAGRRPRKRLGCRGRIVFQRRGGDSPAGRTAGCVRRPVQYFCARALLLLRSDARASLLAGCRYANDDCVRAGLSRCEAQRFGLCQLYISGYGCCSHSHMPFTDCAATCSVTHVQLRRSAPMGAMGPAAKTGQLPRTHSLATYSRKTPATHTGPRAHPSRAPRCLFVPGLVLNRLFTLHMRCCLVTCTDAGH